jgi:hypothetical protein
MAKPPKRVIRFYHNTKYALQTIKSKKVTFLHRDKLNDPFDPHFSFTTDFNENYEELIAFVNKYHPEDIENFLGNFSDTNWERFKTGIKEKFDYFRENMFLFSTSAIRKNNHPKDNLYLWGHYGNGHRGVAIEFDTDLLKNAVLKKNQRLGNEEPDFDDIWSEVNYTNKPPIIKGESIYKVVTQYQTHNSDEQKGTELEEIIKLMVRSKSMNWKKENEWRLMWLDEETRLKIKKISMIDGTVTAIYLGCLVADFLKDDFVYETKRNFPNAKIFEGKKSMRGFKLDFHQLS